MLRARASFSGSMTGLRPPFRPRAAAAARPARVRSRIRSRSNCPSAPNRWNTSRPPGVVLSIASVIERKPTPLFERRHGFDQMHERAAEPVELPNDEHVALAHIVERLAQARSIGTSAGGALREDLCATGRGESVELQRRILVERADASIADERHGFLSVFPSGNHAVRLAVESPAFPVRSPLTATALTRAARTASRGPGPRRRTDGAGSDHSQHDHRVKSSQSGFSTAITRSVTARTCSGTAASSCKSTDRRVARGVKPALAASVYDPDRGKASPVGIAGSRALSR